MSRLLGVSVDPAKGGLQKVAWKPGTCASMPAEKAATATKFESVGDVVELLEEPCLAPIVE